jgi:hypothetical protein
MIKADDVVTAAYRHASHFSLSQALSFTLSMPGSAPRLSLFTDITHNLEHYQTERSIQQWRCEMQAWHSRIRDNVSIDQVGKGEAGGPRWWDGKWDEKRAEQRARGGLVQSLIDTASNQNTTATTRDNLPLPHIHLAWDGMIVDFDPEV